MITEFFPRQDAAATTIAAELPQLSTLETLTTDREQAQVVAQVVRAVHDHVTTKRRGHKLKMPEELLKSLFADIASEATPVLVGHSADNPAGGVHMSHLLHRTFGPLNPELNKLSSWQAFYKNLKSFVQPLLDFVTNRRKSHAFHHYLFEPPDVDGGSAEGSAKSKERLKRKRRKQDDDAAMNLLALAPMVRTTPQVVLPDGEAHAVDEWDRAHAVMRNHVVALQERVTSPPSSPRMKPRVTKLTESECFQLSVRRSQGTTRQTADELMNLFHLCNVDTTVAPATYNPAFDRNDLFFTNVAMARDLFTQERLFTQLALTRKAQSLPIVADGVEYPAVVMVFVQYVGPIGADGTTYKCRYVTWCHKAAVQSVSANPVLHSCAFLDQVLSGEVRLNDGFTDLLDTLARLSCADSAMWKRRFAVHIVDDSCGLVSQDALPSFVALLDSYTEQYGGVGKTRDTDGIVLLGFNLAQHNHARHRLIFEAGSVDTYRCIWQCNHHKAQYEKAYEKAVKATQLVMDTASTFYLQLTKYVADKTVKAGVAASKVHPLARLVVNNHAAVATAMKDLKCMYDRYCAAAQERKQKVDEAYAMALVQSYQDKGAMSQSVQQLHDDVQQPHTAHISDFRHLYGKQERVTAVKDRVLETWFFPCNPQFEGWSEAERKIRVQDDSKAKYSVKLLRALMLLNMWTLPSTDVKDWWLDALPDAPPARLDGATLAANFRATILTTHTDKNVQKMRDGVVSADQLNKESSKVLKARDLLQRHLIN